MFKITSRVRLNRRLAALAAGAACLALAAPAYADQQVYFTTAGQSCGPIKTTVSVSGYNQYGSHATWSGSSGDRTSVFTRGWWWHGNVVIRVNGRSVSGYVPANHDVTDGPGNQVEITCSGTRYFPTYWRFNNLGGKTFLLLSNTVAYDPFFGKYVSRAYTFGYWAGHYVYKINDHVGVDINNGQIVVAQTTEHWIVLGAAVAGARACNAGLTGLPSTLPEKAVILSWCGVGGALGAVLQ